MKNWALLLASAVVVTSAVTLRAQQVDQGADMGGGGDAGAVDNGGADTGGGFGGGGINGNQGGGGGRGGRTRGGGFGQQGQGGQAGQQGGRQGRQQQGGQQLGQAQQLQLGGGGQQQGGIQQLGQQQGGGQQYNPSARNLLMIQQALTSPDEEWAVLLPKVQALLDAQTLGSTNVRGLAGAFGGGGGGRGGRGQQGGQGGFGAQQAIDANANPVAAAQLDLETTLQDMNASDELIRVKLKALRDAKVKVKTLLAKAQDDLREYLTLRQEAVLIQYGYME